jgi:hypothetical protein
VALFATACFDNDKLTGTVQTLELTARKDYTPVRFTDGIHRFAKDTKFQIPARLEVLNGNAGNHKSYLFFKKEKDKKESSCEYQGGSSQAEPKGKKELDKAKFYHFVKCTDGSKSESVATAQDLRLRVENGGDSKVSKYTQVKAVISYEAPAAPIPTATPSPLPTPQITPTVVTTVLPTASPTPDIFAGLPPDPGESGKATLQGIDADNDGVRDDIQRWTVQNIPNLPRVRALAKIRQMRFQLTMRAKAAGASGVQEDLSATKSDGCLFIELKKSKSASEANKILSELEALEQNTEERFKKSFEITKSLSGTSIPTPTDAECSAI